MTAAGRLTFVRAVHTAIFIATASAVFVVLYAGITGASGVWPWVALGMVGVESLVFAANGWQCPLTAIAAKYEPGIPETFLPARLTRYTFRSSGS